MCRLCEARIHCSGMSLSTRSPSVRTNDTFPAALSERIQLAWVSKISGNVDE